MKKFLVLAVVLAFSTSAYGVAIYQNDFGTDDQYNGLVWTVPRGTMVWDAGVPNPPGDLDTDTLYRGIKLDTSWSARYGQKWIYAPAFKTMGDLTIQGYGVGHNASHNSGATWSLSDDGVTYDHSIGTLDTSSWHQRSISSGTDADYNDVYRVRAMAEVHYNSGGGYSDGYAGRTGALEVLGTVGDPTGADRVLLTSNDMGTATQQSGWVPSYTDYADTWSDDNKGVGDRDQDNESGAINYVWGGTGSTHYYTLQITAPDGMTFTDVIGEYDGFSHSTSHGSNTRIAFSPDNVNWYNSTGGGDYNYHVTADCTGIAELSDINTLYVRLGLYHWYAGAFLPIVKNVEISGVVPEPVTLLLLGLGSTVLLRRRKK